MTAIEKMVEWLDSRLAKLENVVAPVLLKIIKNKARRLAAEEKSKPAPVEAKVTAPFRPSYCPTCQACIKSTERRIDGDSVCINGHKHPTKDFYKPTKATAEGSLVALCWELLEMAENPDAIVARATEDSEAVYKSECFDFEKARQTLSRFRPASPAVEELAKEIREVVKQTTLYTHQRLSKIEQILAKYDNAKGGK